MIDLKRLFKNPKASSEIIGYTLVLGIVISVSSIAYVNSYNLANEAKESVKIRSVWECFKEVQKIVEYSSFKKNPKKTIRVMVESGTISLNKGGEIEIDVRDTMNNIVYLKKYNLGVLKYDSNNYKIAVENGGVWQNVRGGTVSASEPKIFLLNESVSGSDVIFTTVTKINGRGSIGGGSVDIETRYNCSSSKIYTDSGWLTYKITSEFATAWQLYLKELGEKNSFDSSKYMVSRVGDTVQLRIYYDKLILTEYELDIDVDTIV